MTRRQSQLLNFIREFISHNGYSPNLREMADEMKLISKGSVSRLLECLHKQGHVIWTKQTARSVRPVDYCGDDLAGIDSALMTAELKRRGFTVVNPMSTTEVEGL
jgi:SOS-response transcriptional repressor LexA